MSGKTERVQEIFAYVTFCTSASTGVEELSQVRGASYLNLGELIMIFLSLSSSTSFR